MAVSVFEHPALNAAASARSSVSPLSQGLAVLALTVATWEVRARTRAALRALPPERLGDIGLTTAEALIEGDKPFWQR